MATESSHCTRSMPVSGFSKPQDLRLKRSLLSISVFALPCNVVLCRAALRAL